MLTLIEIDPTELVVDSNVRSNLGDLAPLVASIKEKGVLVPLLVAKTNGSFHVIAGGRRRAAAIKAKAKTVPCVVRDGDAQGFLEDQMIENLQRKDLGAADEAKGYEQLAAFGMEPQDIAKLAGRDVDHVKKALTVAGSVIAHGVAKKYDALTLDQAAAIAEFEDDKDAVKTLTVKALSAEVAEFPHLVERLRSDRDRKAAVAKFRADLTEKKVPLLEQTPTHQIERAPTRLTELLTDKRKEITPASHKKCPGHAAYIVDHPFNRAQVIYACTDPKGNGHKPKFASSASTPGQGDKSQAEREKETAERREMLANNKAWKLATPIRQQFVTDLLKRKQAPNGVLRFVAEEIMGDPNSLGGKMGDSNERLVAEFLGVKDAAKGHKYNRKAGLAAVKDAPNARLPLVLLAQIAADREQFMDHTTWRLGSEDSARWLRFLESVGYGLSDVEKIAAARGAA